LKKIFSTIILLQNVAFEKGIDLNINKPSVLSVQSVAIKLGAYTN